jgi:acetate---CoA ligase (ADP-forming)
VLGERTYPSVQALPEVPDLALILVAAHRVPAVVEACGAKGISFCIIFSSGFAEAGADGAQAQQRIVEIARRYRMGVIGPNCQGMLNAWQGVAAGFGAPFTLPYRPGPVSLISQSGGFGGAMLMMAHEEGLGFRHFVTTGNECDIGTLDLMEYFCGDPETRVIAAYIEGLGDARRLIDVGRAALSVRKPLLVWKAGNTEVGARAVVSHTANMAGSAVLYRAAFRQIGAIEIADVGDLADCAKALIPGRLPRGNRVAVVTTSGGAGIVMADRYVDSGMQVLPLTPESSARLSAVLPGFAAVGNPIDTTATVIDDPGRLREALSIIAHDPSIDCLSLACAALSGDVALNIAQAVVAVHRETDKPILLAWNAPPELTREAYELVDREGIPRFRTPVRCARALSALCHYGSAVVRHASVGEKPSVGVHRPSVKDALASRRSGLSEFEAKRILCNYGIPLTRELLVARREDVTLAAREIGFPMAMKVQSPSIPHKTEAGGVRLGITDVEAVAVAWDEIMANARRYAPEARIDGILLQEQVQNAVEVIVGVNNDPAFGPSVMVGMGGIFAEIMNDVSVRVGPVTHIEALRMLRELRGFPILDGARGRPKADVDAIAEILVLASALAVDLSDVVAQVDINPVFVLLAGAGAKAGDALIKLKGVS